MGEKQDPIAGHRVCIKCKQSLLEVPKNFRYRKRREEKTVRYTYSKTCKQCEREYEERRKEQSEETRLKQTEFEQTVTDLEAIYGPFPTWDKHVHDLHTKMLWERVAKCDPSIEIAPDPNKVRFARQIRHDYGSPFFNHQIRYVGPEDRSN